MEVIIGQYGNSSIHSVLEILRRCKSYPTLQNKWSTLGRKLRIHEITLEGLRKDLLKETRSFEDVMTKLLEYWTAQESNMATLKKLCTALDACGWGDMSNTLEELLPRIPFPKITISQEFLFPNELQEKVIFDFVPKKSPGYYIPRTLSPQNRVDPNIFGEDSKDIFVISGLGRVELTNLALGNRTNTSSNQIWDITVRFILLEHPLHFDKICQEASRCHHDANFAVHLIRHENGAFFCEKTQGSLTLIRKFIHGEQKLLSEEEFVTHVVCNKQPYPVCIADSPGMGKTFLLQNLARHVREKFKQRSVLFFPIKKFINMFGQVNDAIELRQHISTQTFSSSSEQLYLELFLDAFQDVLPPQMEQCKQLFESLKQMDRVRIYVTTRPDMRDELEGSLGVVSYNIQPFNEENQLEFLTTFWISESKAKNNEQLTSFSKSCLRKLKDCINKSKEDIAGIPLQCRMIADVYSEGACIVSSGSPLRETFNISSIFDLYQRLVDHKIQLFCQKYPSLEAKHLLNAHVAAAMHVVFPFWILNDPECIKIDEARVSESQIYSVGLIEGTNSTPPKNLERRFVHRTIAEYLIAQHLVQNFNGCKDCRELLFVDVLGQPREHQFPLVGHESPLESLQNLKIYKSQYPVILYFVNCFLKQNRPPNVLKKEIRILAVAKPFLCQTNSQYEILSACSVNGLHRCFEIVYITLEIHLDEEMLGRLVLTATFFSNNAELLQHITELVTQHGKNVTTLPYPSYKDKVTQKDSTLSPLHVAIIRGSYTLTEYFFSLYGEQLSYLPSLLHICVDQSSYDNSEIVAEKEDIIKYLVSKIKILFSNEWKNKLTFPPDNIHEALRRRLIEEGVYKEYYLKNATSAN